jgi:hypothetical protein
MSRSKRGRSPSDHEQPPNRIAPSSHRQMSSEEKLKDKANDLKDRIDSYCEKLHNASTTSTFTVTEMRVHHTSGLDLYNDIESDINSILISEGVIDEATKRTIAFLYDKIFFAYHNVWLSAWLKENGDLDLRSAWTVSFWKRFHAKKERVAFRIIDLAHRDDAESMHAKAGLLQLRANLREKMCETVRCTSEYGFWFDLMLND